MDIARLQESFLFSFLLFFFFFCNVKLSFFFIKLDSFVGNG